MNNAFNASVAYYMEVLEHFGTKICMKTWYSSKFFSSNIWDQMSQNIY